MKNWGQTSKFKGEQARQAFVSPVTVM